MGVAQRSAGTCQLVASDLIFGRERELAEIARVLADDSRGQPRAVLIEGQAGIGKTTIWRTAVRPMQERGPVLVARGSEAETNLSFALLGDLLEPAVGEVLDGLPVPQRRALQTALLLTASSANRPDPRAVALGALGALRSLAGQGALTIAIDDVQWVDVPSARALGFALRRLKEEQVAVVATRRSAGVRGPLDLAGAFSSDVHRIALGPIGSQALGQLLRDRLMNRFPLPLVKRIHETSGGNPLYGLEIARELVRQGTLPEPGQPLPVPPDLGSLLQGRLVRLSGEARQVLLFIASAGNPTLGLVEAVDGLPILEEVEQAGIVVVSGTAIEFTHPLFASAVYASASASARQAVNRRLAQITNDPEEHARHLALSVSQPDEHIAATLDRAASHARARGAPQSAADLCGLALAATPRGDTESHRQRATSRAGNLYDAGDPDGARNIMAAIVGDPEQLGDARADALYMLSVFSWNDVRRVSELLEQALKQVDDDAGLRSRILSDLCWVGLNSCDLAAAVERGREAVKVGESLEDKPFVRGLALSVCAMAERLAGRPAEHLMTHALSFQGPLAHADLASPATCLGRQLTWAGELDAARETLSLELGRFREQGHESACWAILAPLGEVEYRAGQWEKAALHADEAAQIALEARLSDVLSDLYPLRAALAGVTGDLDGARREASAGLALCERTGDKWNEIRCRSALGLLELSLDQPAAVHALLEPAVALTGAMGLREPGAFPFVPDEVEALVALGEIEQAGRLADRLEEQGQRLGRPLALATAARSRGLVAFALGDPPGALAHLQSALDLHEKVPQPFELGRTLLVTGRLQRRMKQKTPARTTLTRALAIFGQLHAPIWAEHARSELSRIGGRAPSPNGLTPAEQQVAHLVAEGCTNREVARRLFISVNTVEANLKRVYRKLDVRSRTELANRLATARGDAETHGFR